MHLFISVRDRILSQMPETAGGHQEPGTDWSPCGRQAPSCSGLLPRICVSSKLESGTQGGIQVKHPNSGYRLLNHKAEMPAPSKIILKPYGFEKVQACPHARTSRYGFS